MGILAIKESNSIVNDFLVLDKIAFITITSKMYNHKSSCSDIFVEGTSV